MSDESDYWHERWQSADIRARKLREAILAVYPNAATRPAILNEALDYEYNIKVNENMME